MQSETGALEYSLKKHSGGDAKNEKIDLPFPYVTSLK